MIVGLLGLVLAPSPARAIEVMCQNEQGGACTLSNDPEQIYECTCEGEFIEGTTGGSMNPWADLDEAELLEICEASLPAECPAGGSTTTGGTGNADETGPVTTDPSGPNSATSPDSDTNPVSESSGGQDDGDDDDDDKGCSVGGRARTAPAWLAVLALGAWRRRVRPAAG